MSQETAEAFFRVIDAAYERRSIALSSNLHPAGFDEIMPKQLAVAATDPKKASAEERLRRRRRVYLAPKLLNIDEFGIWPYDREAATALFSLVAERYERGSIILTSNKGFAEWGDLLGDTVVATAILDRLLHHSHVLNIRGSSYRLREKQQAGLQAGLTTSHQWMKPASEESQAPK